MGKYSSGVFWDKKSSIQSVVTKAQEIWQPFGLKDIKPNKEGFIFFQFSDIEGMDGVINRGLWVLLGQAIFLKKWNRDFDFSKESFKSYPIWIKMFGILTTYWTQMRLSAIASKLGIPLFVDELTSSMKMMDFARVCIDMPATSDFPLSFEALTEHNDMLEVRIEYSWKPRRCSVCKIFGHTTSNCNLNTINTSSHTHRNSTTPRQQYVPKAKPNSSTPILDPVQTAPQTNKQATVQIVQQNPIVPAPNVVKKAIVKTTNASAASHATIKQKSHVISNSF